MKCKIQTILQKIIIGFVITLYTSVSATPDTHTNTTLQQAVTAAISTHPKIDMARDSILAAQHDIDEARAGYFPSVDLTYSHGREKSELPGQSPKVLSRLERQISVSEMLFDGMQTANRVSQKEFQTLSEQFSLLEQSQKIALDTTNIYLDILMLQKILELNISNINLHKSFVGKMTALYEGHTGTKTDIELAQSRLLMAEGQRIETQKILDNAEITYIFLVGARPGKLTMPNHHFTLPYRLAPLTQCAKAHLPILKKDQANYASLKAGARSQRAAFLPKLTLDLLATRNNNISGIPGVNNNARAVLTVRYNLFRGGADRAVIDREEALALQAHHKLMDDLRMVHQSIRTGLNNWFADQQRLSTQQKRVQAMRQVVESFNQQFLIGRRPLLNVLDMEKELFEAKIAVEQSKFLVLKDNYALYASTGTLLERLQINSKNEETNDGAY